MQPSEAWHTWIIFFFGKSQGLNILSGSILIANIAVPQDAYQRRADVINRGYSGYNTDWVLHILPEILDGLPLPKVLEMYKTCMRPIATAGRFEFTLTLYQKLNFFWVAIFVLFFTHTTGRASSHGCTLIV
jgi:hypothetical protein